LNKDYKTNQEILDEVHSSSSSVNVFNLSQKSSDTIQTPEYLNYLLGKGFYFEDTAGIVFKSVDLFYTRANILDNLGIGFDAGLFSIERKRVTKKHSGTRYGVSVDYENFIFRLGINKFENFTEIVPSVEYSNRYENHSYKLEYKKQNAMFYTYSVCPVVSEVSANHFGVSDYITFEGDTDLWASLILNLYDNDDVETTFMYDWRFYHDTVFSENFTYHLALEGWYSSHSLENNCFYSPSFTDSTLVRIDPQYRFNKHFSIKGKLGLGYSFVEESLQYKYGLWLLGDINKASSYSLGCLQSNSAGLSNRSEYSYKECQLSMDYKW